MKHTEIKLESQVYQQLLDQRLPGEHETQTLERIWNWYKSSRKYFPSSESFSSEDVSWEE
jgi:hypothetical protein